MPTWLRILASKSFAFFSRTRLDRDFDREVAVHISLLTEKFIREGMTQEEAACAARRQFGGVAQIKENIAENRGLPAMERLFRDMLYALRTLQKNPAFCVTAVLTLALGIGGNAAMFTVIRAVLLKPLAYHDPDRLVRLSVDNARLRVKDVGFNQIRYEELKASVQSFSSMGTFFVSREEMTLVANGDPESIKVARVSSNFLDVLGIKPSLGRSFIQEEDTPGGHSSLMISSELWQRRFGGDPMIAGKQVTLNATPFTVAGVLPSGFAFPAAGLDAWVTRPSEYSGLPPQTWRTNGYLLGIARLKPRVSLEQARAELEVLSRQFAAANPGESQTTLRMALLQDQLVANVRPILWMLFGAVGFVLLIACANVASLQLGRATSRSREFAIRAALGASRSRMIAQLLTESLVLAVAGGAAGILLAKWALIALIHSDALNLPRSQEMRLDGLVLAFTAGLSIGAGVLFGLIPALRASRPDLNDALRASGEATQSPGRTGGLGISARGLLVVVQVALSVVLLIGAGLLLESFARLTGVDPGFHPASLLTMQIALPTSRYDMQKQAAFFDELIKRVEALPGVTGVTAARTLPLTARIAIPVAVAELPPVDLKDRPTAQMQTVSPRYFETLGISLRRGRVFADRDRPDSGTLPLIVNESLARRFWPAYPRGLNPVGQHLLLGNGKNVWQIVGVVADVHEGALDKDTSSEFYLPLFDNPVSTAALVVRTHGDPHRLVKAVREQVLAIDGGQAVSNVRTMDEVIESSVGQRRLTLVLLASFAGVAMLLSVIGLYGALAYSVAQRTRELAIRRALGAGQGEIHRLVTGQGLGLTLAGIVLGVGGAAALTRTIQSLLFHVSPLDPPVFLGIAFIFMVVALAASYIPACQATRIDPMRTLR
jgi:putative ABC transport system permease protein